MIVRPGEKFPLDGTVLRGCSSVNQAPLTGESTPIFKQPGDSVFAGTINGEDVIEFTVTRPADDTTWRKSSTWFVMPRRAGRRVNNGSNGSPSTTRPPW